VLPWYEVCDAVQVEEYEIDEVVVSNFVLPLYFTPGEPVRGRNAFSVASSMGLHCSLSG
jgi:hypothetical protein